MIHLMRLLDGTFLEAFSESIFLCGRNLYLVVALGTVTTLAVHRVDLVDLKGKVPGMLHISCLLMSVGFFPTFMFDSVQGAIMGYALAHGLQYFVFMYFVSAKNSVYCPRVLGQWFDGIRFYAAASSPTRSRRTWAGLR